MPDMDDERIFAAGTDPAAPGTPPAAGVAARARRHRRALLGAAGILAVGLAVSAVKFRQASWLSVVVASVYMIVMAVLQGKEE